MKLTPEGTQQIQALLKHSAKDASTIQRTLLRIRNHIFGKFFYDELAREFFDEIYDMENPVKVLWDDILFSSQMWSPDLGAVAHAMCVLDGSVKFALAQVGGIEISDPMIAESLSEDLQAMTFKVRSETYLITTSKTFLSPSAIDQFAPSLISHDIENRDWVQCPDESWGAAIKMLLLREKK